ncbi:MAG: hypothetical protein HWE10_00735, partial [Gammaproteobacteria bacterium]|nr:hypothetical protein [Gammaproteobacteria bacterium]
MKFNVTPIKLIIYCFVVMVASACAASNTTEKAERKPSITFDYNSHNKLLTINGDICRYGKSAKQELPSFAINDIHNYIQQQPNSFIEQLKNIKTGMMGNRLDTAKLSVFYLLKTQNMDFAYRYEGNQVCARYNTSLALDFSQDFIDFIELNAPHQYQFVADKTDAQAIRAILTSIYPDLHASNASEPFTQSEYLVEDRVLTEKLSVFTFHYLNYQANLLQRQSLVFTTGDGLYLKALNHYLQENKFTLTNEKNSAFWQLHIKNDSTNHSPYAFSVEFKKHDLDTTSVFNNDVSALPAIPTPSNTDKINLIKLYLEMQSFSQQLNNN